MDVVEETSREECVPWGQNCRNRAIATPRKEVFNSKLSFSNGSSKKSKELQLVFVCKFHLNHILCSLLRRVFVFRNSALQHTHPSTHLLLMIFLHFLSGEFSVLYHIFRLLFWQLEIMHHHHHHHNHRDHHHYYHRHQLLLCLDVFVFSLGWRD